MNKYCITVTLSFNQIGQGNRHINPKGEVKVKALLHKPKPLEVLMHTDWSENLSKRITIDPSP